MNNTIDRYWLNRHIIEMPKKIARPDRALYANLLIAEVNDYDCANLANQYLWHIDTAKGTATWNAIRAIIPPKYSYLYITYTNCLKGNRFIRMTQNVWAFPNTNIAEQYLPDIIAELQLVPHSHLLKVELNDQHNLQEKLIDYYYFNDNTALAKRGARYRSLAQTKAITKLPTNISLKQFKHIYHYQERLFKYQINVIKSGLTHKNRVENKILNNQRKKLLLACKSV